MVKRMTGYEEKACHCGEDSGRLSQLSYQEPPVASSSGLFPSEGSPQPIPVPPPAVVGGGPEFPASPSSPGDSDKENSNEGSVESTQQVVTELVEIREVQDEEAQALSDAMDEEVRSCLFQRCRSKNHPERFHPYPKGWQNGLRPCERRRTFQQGGAERERFVRTRNLQEGLLGNADVESDHSQLW